MDHRKRVVGTHTVNYAEIRNFIGLPFEKYAFEKKQNLYKIPAVAYTRLTNKTHSYYWNSYRDFDLNKVDLFHFFNTISFGNTPWITTFETFLPRREGKNDEAGLKLMAGEACQKLIAMSECAANIQRTFLSDKYPQFLDVINEKLMVLHPAQKCPPREEVQKDISGPLTFTIVGSDFFRKGGKEILIAFDRLSEKGIQDWCLNIVSKMQFGDYASRTTKEDVRFAHKLIDKYPHNINYQSQIPNAEVLALFKKTHIGLLPTYADTYGYSVLEAQSFACPVISTNIRALPEINSHELGWLIEVSKDSWGNAILTSEKYISAFSSHLVDELEKTLTEIFENPSQILAKGERAYQKLLPSIEHNTQVLENLYDGIVEG